MTVEEMEKVVKNSLEMQRRYKSEFFTFVGIRGYKCIFPFTDCCIVLFYRKNNYDDLYFEVCEIKNNEVGKHFSLLPCRIDKEDEVLNEMNVDLNYSNGIFLKQVSSFRVPNVDMFQYDFNHDGVDEFLSISSDYIVNYVSIKRPKLPEFAYGWILRFSYARFSEKKLCIEFINYKCRQGIKVCIYNYAIDSDEWRFYYYDRLQQKYVQDEEATSEVLEQIHGSPDFFAEAGIDYTKLMRPLVPADLEGFSKPALRIWRNAVYARHGRMFASEDLQALFNEYAWYKPDEEYSDEKLSAIDRANIKLIKEFEKKQ